MLRKLILILAILLYSCTNTTLGPEGIGYTDEEKCSVEGTRCKDNTIQICADSYWINILNCGEIDGGTCCLDGGVANCCTIEEDGI
jgi:hypothetical protein